VNLKNKVVLITGAAGRVGESVAFDVAKYGGDLILNDIDAEKLKKLKTQILKENKTEILTINQDISNKEGINNLLDKALKFKGIINATIHSAYPRSKSWGTKFEDLKFEDLNENLSSQLGGAIILSQQILKIYTNQNYGNLIHISSIQGLGAPKFKHYENTNMSSPIEYSAIKSGIITITKWLAKYHSNRNIRVNCVSPGGILDNQPNTFLENYRKSCCNIGMLTARKHISEIITFLISDSASAINGQNIIVDDGWSL